MKRIAFAFILAIPLALCGLMLAPYTANAATQMVEVEAEGSGATKMDALQSAWMEAVRLGVGMFLTSKSEALDDNLTEKVVIHSRGQVNSFKVLSEAKNGNIWTVKIAAKIDKDILEETADAVRSKAVAFDGKNEAAKRATQAEKRKSAFLALLESAELFNFTKCLDYQPQIVKKTDAQKGTERYFMLHRIRIDIKKFMVLSRQLENVIAPLAVESKDIQVNTEEMQKLLASIRREKVNIDPMVLTDNNLRPGYSLTLQKQRGYQFGFLKNTAEASWYKLEIKIPEDLVAELKQKYNESLDIRLLSTIFTNSLPVNYNMNFKVDLGTGDFDSVLAAREALMLRFPQVYTNDGITGYIYPAMNVRKYGGAGYDTGDFIFIQELKLSDEQLLNVDKITGSYTLKRIK